MFLAYLKEYFLPTVDGSMSMYQAQMAKLSRVTEKQKERAEKKAEAAQRALQAADRANKESARATRIRAKLETIFGDDDGDGIPNIVDPT